MDSMDAARMLLNSFRIEQSKMPDPEQVFEVSATPFEAVSVICLFDESVLRIKRSKELWEEGVSGSGVDPEYAVSFFDRYANPDDHAAGAAAARRLATHTPTLAYAELCCIAVICHLGVALMRDSGDWAEHVAGWFSKVRDQVLEDYAVRSEA